MKSKSKILLFVTPACLLLACIAVWAGTNAMYHYNSTNKNRLEFITYDDNTAIIYGYDENGNRVSRRVDRQPFDPSNGSFSDPGGSHFTLSWTGGDPDADSVTYHLYLGEDQNQMADQTPNGITAENFTLQGLSCGTTYYWSIKAIDQYGVEKQGTAVWSFTTNAASSPIKNARTGTTYTSIQTAYGEASDGDTILSQDVLFDEPTFNANVNKSVVMDGGYSCDFYSNPNKTTLRGAPTISSGTVTLQNYIITN